jgi:hypothetical protein
MKQILFTVAYVIGCFALCLGLVSCVGTMSKEQESAAFDFQETLAFVFADGVVTPDEAAEVDLKWKAVRAAPAGPGVGTMIGATLGTLALTIYPALRAVLPLIPNRHILGTEPDPEVARVAGKV